MVAVPASQPDEIVAKAPISCVDCQSLLSAPGHVCLACGKPQPVPAGVDYFAALSVPRRFIQDRAALEKHFYEASRALHPDRFTTSGAAAKLRSLERMSWVNQAYQTLKQPEALRSYVLESEGVATPKAQIPEELAEDWFEIRDMMMEEPEIGVALLEKFEEKLAVVKAERAAQLVELEGRADSAADAADVAGRRGILDRIAHVAQEKNYIASMERDIERIKKQFS